MGNLDLMYFLKSSGSHPTGKTKVYMISKIKANDVRWINVFLYQKPLIP